MLNRRYMVRMLSFTLFHLILIKDKTRIRHKKHWEVSIRHDLFEFKTSYYKLEGHFFRTGRRIAPKFCTHTCADRDENGSHLKKIGPTPPQSNTKPIRIEGRPSAVRLSSEGVDKSAMRMRRFALLYVSLWYPRGVATVLSRQPDATSPLDGNHWQLSTRSSTWQPSHSTKGKTVRAHCRYTSDQQYNYNKKLYN